MNSIEAIKEDIFEMANKEVERSDDLQMDEAKDQQKDEGHVTGDKEVEIHEKKQTEDIFSEELLKSATSNVPESESLVELSSSKLYGDIFEMEKSDMEFSDSDSRDLGNKREVKAASMNVANGVSKIKGKDSFTKLSVDATEDECHLSGPEEGEILELAPAAEDMAMLGACNTSGNENQRLPTPAVQEYYDRLGKIFSEAKRMSLEIRKGFSQLFSEDQLKVLEKQMTDMSQQNIQNLPKLDEKSKFHVKGEQDSRKKRSRSRARHGGERSRHSNRHHRSSRHRRNHSRRRASSRGERPRHRTRSREASKRDTGPRNGYNSGQKQPTGSQSKNNRDKSNHHQKSSPSRHRDVQRSEIGKRTTSPRSFLKDNRSNAIARNEPKTPVIIDGKEKQRAKTLVNRQMKLISRHMDNANAKPIPNSWDFESQRSPVDERSFKPSNRMEILSKPTDIRCLQDLEHFMDLLRAKNRNKNMSDEDIFAQLNKMRHDDNTKENLLPSNQDSQINEYFKEMTMRPEKNKGLYFQSSSKSKFKDTFTEQEGERNSATKRDSKTAKPIARSNNIKKNVPRTPVKFEMKTSKNIGAKPTALFSNSDSDSTSSRRSGNSRRSYSSSDSSDTDRSRSRGRRDRRSFSRRRQNKYRRRSESSYSYSSRSRTNSPDERYNKESTPEKKSNTEQKVHELPSDKVFATDPQLETKSAMNCRRRPNEEIDGHKDDSLSTLEAKRQKLLKEYADIETKLSSQKENDKNETDSDASLSNEPSTNHRDVDKRTVKTKPSKKIVILGNKDDLKKLIISPTLKKALISGKLKQGILLKVVKHKDKRRTIEEVNEDLETLKVSDDKSCVSAESKKTLDELEAFMDDLRLKQKPNPDDQSEAELVISDFTRRESRFLDRHKLKRKAKLMACIALPDKVANKEAKLLESMRRRNSGVESEMTKVLQRLQVENEAVMMGSTKRDLTKIIAPDSQPPQDKISTDNKDVTTSLVVTPNDGPPTVTPVVKKDYFLSSKAQSLLNRAKKTNTAARGRTQCVPISQKLESEEIPINLFEVPLPPLPISLTE